MEYLARGSARRPREITGEFDLARDPTRRWVEQADLHAGRRKDGLSATDRKELAKLRREILGLRMERAISEKAAVPPENQFQ